MVESTRTRLIKKYANRKLYDTHDRRYVTKEILNDLVAEGYEVRVIDKETGSDITRETVETPQVHRRQAAPAGAAEAVRQQLVHALRGGLMLPIEVGQRAVSRWERRTGPVDPDDYADLCARVDDLSDEVAELRALIAGGKTARGR